MFEAIKMFFSIIRNTGVTRHLTGLSYVQLLNDYGSLTITFGKNNPNDHFQELNETLEAIAKTSKGNHTLEADENGRYRLTLYLTEEDQERIRGVLS